jgi:formylmethanofuran:tetrahydromethanopterin formyltransferase
MKDYIHKDQVQKMINEALKKENKYSELSGSDNHKWLTSFKDKLKNTKTNTIEDGLYVGDSVYARV